MKDVSPEERPKVGQMVNDVRIEIESILEETKAKLEAFVMESKLKNEEGPPNQSLDQIKNIQIHNKNNPKNIEFKNSIKHSVIKGTKDLLISKALKKTLKWLADESKVSEDKYLLSLAKRYTGKKTGFESLKQQILRIQKNPKKYLPQKW